MANKIQVKRGVLANLPTLSVGEPAFTTDTNEFFIGNGTANVKLAKASDLSELAYEKVNRTITVGAGKQFTTIQSAIDSVKKYIYSNVIIDIEIDAGTYNEDVSIIGFYGGGALIINSGRTIINVNVKSVSLNNCGCIIQCYGINATSTTAHGFFLSNIACSLFKYNSCTTATTTYSGLIAFQCPSVQIINSVFSNRASGIQSCNNSQVYSATNSGNGNIQGLTASTNSTIGKSGTQPTGTTAEVSNYGGVIR